MGILAWLILGLIAGFIGSKIVNKSGEGLIIDIVLGIVERSSADTFLHSSDTPESRASICTACSLPWLARSWCC